MEEIFANVKKFNVIDVDLKSRKCEFGQQLSTRLPDKNFNPIKKLSRSKKYHQNIENRNRKIQEYFHENPI